MFVCKSAFSILPAKFVHGAESAGENDQGFCHLREPQLAHEEIVETKIQLLGNVRVGTLLVRKLDAEPHGRSARFGCAAVGRLHDTGAASRANHESFWVVAESERPLRDAAREFPRFLVVARHIHHGARRANLGAPLRRLPAARFPPQFLHSRERAIPGKNARRPEHHDRVGDTRFPQPRQWIEIFRKNPERPRAEALHESGILISKLGHAQMAATFHVISPMRKRTFILVPPPGSTNARARLVSLQATRSLRAESDRLIP